MAEEAAPATAPAAQPSWVGSTDNIIKMLLQGTQPAAVAESATQAIANPWAQALGQEAAPYRSVDMSQAQTAASHGDLTATAGGRGRTASGFPLMQAVLVTQIPLSALLQLDQHQLHPHVEAAKQRLLQALLQRQPSVMPAQHAKGQA